MKNRKPKPPFLFFPSEGKDLDKLKKELLVLVNGLIIGITVSVLSFWFAFTVATILPMAELNPVLEFLAVAWIAATLIGSMFLSYLSVSTISSISSKIRAIRSKRNDLRSNTTS
jgi:hypothetical protein